MRINIAKWGNSAAIRLPKAVMDKLKLAPGAVLDLTVEGRVVKLEARPAAPKRRTLADMLAECDRIGWENQPPIEDWTAVEPPWPEWSDEKAPTSDDPS